MRRHLTHEQKPPEKPVLNNQSPFLFFSQTIKLMYSLGGGGSAMTTGAFV